MNKILINVSNNFSRYCIIYKYTGYEINKLYLYINSHFVYHLFILVSIMMIRQRPSNKD